MIVVKEPLTGKIMDIKNNENTVLNYLLDYESKAINIFDTRRHGSTSLTDLIDSDFIYELLGSLGLEGVENQFACIVYEGNTVCEYSIEREKMGRHPFVTADSEQIEHSFLGSGPINTIV